MHEPNRRNEGRGRGVMAVLGPTNTGKTHLAIDRMLGHESGMIGLPLRLLAREVYDKVRVRAGAANVALITGEEKILPRAPRYYVCTVEAMPRDINVAFLAIDEVQLAADLERGHVFTRHLLHARGASETLLLGASTMKDAIAELLPGANIISRPRLSKLTYAGQKKVSRLPRRSAIVTFNASDLYATAELVRRQRGGAAVVFGALSPKTRNAQVALYQDGEVDFLIATDAIGMGLNLDVDHIAFASIHKFDGRQRRELTNAEIGQIAGRAGRHTNDGTFGVTADVPPFEPQRIMALEDHDFEPVRVLQWRNTNLDFSSIERLVDCLKRKPGESRLIRGGMVADVAALERVIQNERVRQIARAPAAIARLWEVCQIPDYRKISASDHADLITDIYLHLMSQSGTIETDWFARQIKFADNTEGDIDTLSNRISHIRTWTFVSHRSDWLADPAHWQERTRDIEERLSDALHERLTQRFVDRRTSVLIKRLRDRDALNGEIEADGSVFVERHLVGRVSGFQFTPDSKETGIHGKATRHAAARVMSEELSQRAQKLLGAVDTAFALTRRGEIIWETAPVARLERGEHPLRPTIAIIADEHISAQDKERIVGRLTQWLQADIAEKLKPLDDLSRAEDVTGLAKGVAFRLVENLGIVKRDDIATDIRQLDQDARGQLRKYGVRFGAFNIFMPQLLKPAASDLLVLLWTLAHGADAGITPDSLPEPPREGLTSAIADPAIPEAFYRVAGYHPCGRRVARIDMLERLADMIRPLVAWRPGKDTAAAPAEPAPETASPDDTAAAPVEPAPETAPPDETANATQTATAKQSAGETSLEGATGDGGFRVTPDMMSIVGCSGEEFAEILKELGFRSERKPLAPQAEATATTEGADAAETRETPDSGESAAGAPEQPEFDEVWRPRRKQGAGPRGRPRNARYAAAKGPKRQEGKGRKGREKDGKPEPRRYAAGPRKKATVDPDSPFAALQGLKRDLETRVKD